MPRPGMTAKTTRDDLTWSRIRAKKRNVFALLTHRKLDSPRFLDPRLYRPTRTAGHAGADPQKAVLFFSFAIEPNRKVKASRRTIPGKESQRQAVILFIALPHAEDKADLGVFRFSLQKIPRWCPLCLQRTIIGHGQRQRQAHDEHHDWIWVRRGRCQPCKTTFTILPSWLPPYGHYTLWCRKQAWESLCEAGASWEQSAPHTKDPTRLADPSTLRRWAVRRLISLWSWMRSWAPSGRFLSAPTIVAWDWMATTRILLSERMSRELEGAG